MVYGLRLFGRKGLWDLQRYNDKDGESKAAQMSWESHDLTVGEMVFLNLKLTIKPMRGSY